ncbi:anthocyanin 5-aromatic acyltransferase-like [Corylus avellana]|nr:anthocyanin 5-aromatic acyltransferase-like [Corylus avellana]
MCPPPPANPYIFYTHGDSIPLTIAESTADNFHHLAGHHPRDIKHFAHLVPNFPPTQITSTDTFVFPLLSIQVTLFPNAGICVTVTTRHVIDGRIRSLFMKSWASVSKARGGDDDSSCLRPFYDRDVIKDPNGVMAVFLAEYFRVRSTWEKDTSNADVFHGDNVKATYVLNGANMEFLKDKYNFSSFVVTCAFIWVCRMKTEFHEGDTTKPVDDDELCYLAFPADCRNRLKFPVPSTYFGNCLASCKAAAKRSELVGEEGFVVAAKAIAREISRMKSRPLEGAEKWMEDRKNLIRAGNGRVLAVGGSPSFNDYGTDFGWGKPKKFELINHPIFISVADCRDEDGALEVGVVLRSRAAMDTFSSIFEQSLKLLN